MIAEVSPAIHTAIHELESQARFYETRAGQCRDTAATLRELFGVSVLGPSVVMLPPVAAPSREDRDLSRAATALADAVMETETPGLIPPEPPRPADQEDAPVDAPSRRAPAPGPVGLRDTVCAALANGPLSSSVLRERAGATFRGKQVWRRFMDAMVADGLVRSTGKTAGQRYHLVVEGGAPASVEPVAAADQDDPVDDAPAPAIDPTPAEARSGEPTQTLRAKFAFFLTREVFIDGTPHHIGDLVLRINERFGTSDFHLVNETLEELAREGVCRPMSKGGERHWHGVGRPAPPTDVVTRLMASLMAEAFFDGSGEYTLSRLASVARAIPSAGSNELQMALNQLVRARQVCARTVGTERRWRRAS